MQAFQAQRHEVFSVRHLFSAAGRPRLMAVFQAFFDAGGDPENPKVRVFGIAGWIATERNWARLERAWKKVCDREGVSGLHMKDFAHSTGEYAGWKGDEARRSRFLGDLVRIIRQYTNREFSQQTFLDGYRAVDEQFEFHERIGHPYAICALRCMSLVNEWMAKKHPLDDVMFVFEKGDAYQGELHDMLRRDKMNVDPNALIFMEKRWRVGDRIRSFPPLECADFLAYEHYKAISDVYVNRKRGKARTSIWALSGEGKYFLVKDRGYSIVDGLFYELLTKGYNLPRRPGVAQKPIPHEMETMKEIMGDYFHGETRTAERFRITPRPEPLEPLRKRRR